MDQTTGLPLLQLPEGFTYQIFGWSGDLMADGARTRPTTTAWRGALAPRGRAGRDHADPQPRATVNPLYGTIEARASTTAAPR
jgi:hypothetical protein